MRDSNIVFKQNKKKDLCRFPESLRLLKLAMIVCLLGLNLNHLSAQCPIGNNIATCSGSSEIIYLNTLLNYVPPTGTWYWDGTGPAPAGFDENNGTFSPSNSQPGAFTFGFHYYSHQGCNIDGTTYAIINVMPSPQTGVGSHVLTCDAAGVDPAINLYSLLHGEQPGGAWAAHPSNPAGGSFNSIAGTFNPDQAYGKYVFTYSIESGICPLVSSEVYIVVQDDALDVGTGSNINICSSANTKINLYNLLDGEDQGGLWTPSVTNPIGGEFSPEGFFDAGEASTTPPNNVYGFEYSFPSNCNNGPASSLVYITLNEQSDPGLNTEMSVCMGAPILTLLNELNGSPDAGGTWSANPSAGFGPTGTFDPSAVGVTVGSYIFTYTFLPSQGCPSAESTLVINVIDQPSVGTSSDLYVCQGSITPVNLFEVILGEDPGGIWIDDATALEVPNPTALDVSSLAPGLYDYVYSTSVLPGCLAGATSTATLIVNGPQPEAGPGGSITSCNGIVDLTGGLIFTVSPGGTWIDNNNSGVDLSDPMNVDLALLNQGIYSYSYVFGANTGCHIDEAVVTVLIPSDPPNVGEIAQLSVCDNSTETIDLFSLLNNTDPGGSWTTGAGVAHSGLVDVSTLAPVIGSQTISYTYGFGAQQNCPIVDTSVELTVFEHKSAGVGSSVTICEGTGTLNLPDYISGFELGGAWSITGATSNQGVFDPVNGTYDFTGASPGTYFFAYSQSNSSPCQPEQSIVTLVIMENVVQLNAPQFITICESSTETINLRSFVQGLGVTAGGAFTLISGPVGQFDEVTGVFNPIDVSAGSTFIVEHSFDASCVIAPEQITIDVNATVSSGIAENLTVCKDYTAVNTIDLWAQLSGNDLGGTWLDDNNTGVNLTDPADVDLSILPEGTFAFTYKFFASGECDKTSTTVYVNCINEQPYLGYASNASICEGTTDLVNITSLLSGAQLGGNWIDVTGSGVDLSNPETADFSAVLPGTYIFHYTFAPLGTCAADEFIAVSVSVTDIRDAGVDGYYTICGDLTALAPFSINTSGDLGGNWTSGASNPPGSVLNNDQFVPANAFPGLYEFTYNFTSSGGCPGDMANVFVQVISGDPLAAAVLSPPVVCSESTGVFDLTQLITSSSSAGGIWTVDPTTPLPVGSDLNPTAGTILLDNLMAGTYLFDYEFENTLCGSLNGALALELVVESSAVGSDGIITICDHEDLAVNLESVLGILDTPTAGIWTDIKGSGVSLNNPAAVDFSSTPHGTYQFELSVNDPSIACSPDVAIATVIVSSQPSAGIGGKHEVCMFATGEIVVDLNSLLTGQDPGGLWQGPQPEDGGSFDPLTGILTVTSASTLRTYNYTYTFAFSQDSPCDDVSATIKIKVTDDCGNTTPCFATQRYNAGSRWNSDESIDDVATDGGIVKCGTEGTFMTLASPTESYDSDLFEIDLSGTSFYDPYNGYMMTPPLPQEGEDIIWVNFDVRAFVSSFELILQDDEHLAWALYKSNVHTAGTSVFNPTETTQMELSGDCSSLALVRSGLSSDVWNTIMIDYHDFNNPHNYYLAIWDWSDNVNIGDGPNGNIVNALGTRMGCEDEDICTAPIIKHEPSFIDHKDGTYSILVDILAINGEYEAIDKTGQALYISDPVCLTNSSSSAPQTTGSFTLTYPNTVGYSIQIAAVDPKDAVMCGGADNYHYCVSDLSTPPQTPFEVVCDGGHDAEQVYHGFDLIPDNSATDVSVWTSCGSQDIKITYGDIIRQKGEYLYEVERVYTVFAGCQLPGKEDDQQATCSVYYTVDYSTYRPSNICDLACNLNGINVGINEECEAYITPSMVLEGPNTECAEDYYLVLTDPSDKNKKVPNPVNRNYIGKTLQAQVYHINGNQVDNSCWGYVTVEDKLPPVIYCPKPDTISCNAPDPMINLAGWVHDACACFTIEKIGEQLEKYDCDPYSDFAAMKTITYVAIDESGNKSIPCEHKIYYSKDAIDTSDFPEDISISCKDAALYDLNNDGNPDPDFTGAPSLGGRPIGTAHGHCQIQTSYEDQVIPLCDQSYKILRKWTILDWCRPTTEAENNPQFHYQIIKVEDKEGPDMTCYAEDVIMDSDPLECGVKKMKVNMPDINFDCGSGDYRYVIGHKQAVQGGDPYDRPDTTDVYFENGDYWIESMPYGDSWVTCTVYDKCGNSSRCHYMVSVKDHVAPIPVCDENTSVTLSTDKSARVWAESFNDGSFDFCSDVTIAVARREGLECDDTEPSFKEYVDFCCKDIGADHMVVLKVEDASGNHNSCMVRVQIVDKHIPKFHSHPPHQYIYCYEDISKLDMGKPEIDEECSSYQMDYEDIKHVNQCDIGVIIRRWHLWDANGNEMDSYDQEIHIEADKPFVMDPSYWPPNYASDVECEVEVTSPEVAGEPTTDKIDGCALIATTYEDEEFHADAEACLKVLRRWTVVDWCQYDEALPTGQNPGIWKYTQKITLNNVEPPNFEEVCTQVSRNGATGECSYAIELRANVSDDCTTEDQLDVSYNITFEGGQTISGEGLMYSSETAPFGLHKIIWTVKDKCGNTAVCTDTFLLEDDKAPTPYCLSEVSTVISPSTMDVDLWASDFDLGSYDNCPNASLDFRMKLAGTTDTLLQSMTFDCSDAGAKNLEIWIFDSSGNSDICHTVVDIQMNEACSDISGVTTQETSMALIKGTVITEDDIAVEDVMINLQHASFNQDYQQETGFTGKYEFEEMPMHDDYTITPARSDDPLNGVSTLDMVLIQKHILGTTPLDSPYKIIAADINNSQSLSAGDIVSLRQVILGKQSEFANNESWRFIDADQEFFEENQPWPFTEEIDLFDLDVSESVKDFIAVKIGDVNGSASANSNVVAATNRNQQTITVNYPSEEFGRGESISVPLQATKELLIAGIQFTLKYDMTNVEFVNVQSEMEGFGEDHYAVYDQEGLLTLSWHSESLANIQSGEDLITLQFKALTKGNTKDIDLEINSSITRSEAYTQSLEILNIELQEGAETSDIREFMVYQNTPNPFSSETAIEFYTEKPAKDVVLSVFDVNGHLIYSEVSDYNKGSHKIVLSNEMLKTSGLLYYRIQVGNQQKTMSMISIY